MPLFDPEAMLYHFHNEHVRGTSANFAALSCLSRKHPEDAYARICKSGRDNRFRPKVVGFSKSLIARGRYKYAFSHIPQYRVVVPKEATTFTILRDPIQRCMSLYSTTLAHRRYGKSDSMIEYLPGLSDGAGDFLEFLARLPRQKSMFQLGMFSSHHNADEAVENIQCVDHVFAGLDETRRLFADTFKDYRGFPVVTQPKTQLSFTRDDVYRDACKILSEEIAFIHQVVTPKRRSALLYEPDSRTSTYSIY